MLEGCCVTCYSHGRFCFATAVVWLDFGFPLLISPSTLADAEDYPLLETNLDRHQGRGQARQSGRKVCHVFIAGRIETELPIGASRQRCVRCEMFMQSASRPL